MPEVNQELHLREQLTHVQFQGIAINSQESYDHAVKVLTTIKTWRSNWKRYWYGDGDSGPIPLANKAWKGLLEKFGEPDKAAAASEGIVKSKILAWDTEQERIRRAEQERLERVAREKEEADRAAKATEMEMLEVSDEDIQAVLDEPPMAVAEVAPPTYIRSSAVSTRANWVAVVTDLKVLCRAIGGGKVKLSPEDTAKAVEFFEGLLKKRATADTSTMNIPGCKAENHPIVAGRSR